jgi:hypothetical protein
VRWQELLGSGELLRSLDPKVGRLRERVVHAVRGAPQQADRVGLAVEAALQALVEEQGDAAAHRVRAAWEAAPGGRSLVADRPELGRASTDLRRRAGVEIRSWQEEVLELVRAEGADGRDGARALAHGAPGLGVAVMVETLARRTSAGADPAGRRLLEAVFGTTTIAALVERAGDSLERRLSTLVDGERGRFPAVLDALDVPADGPELLRAASRRVDDRRFEQARAGADPTA